MILLRDIKPHQETFTQLSSRVLAVLVRHEGGYSVYVDAVPGISHAREWEEVRKHGNLMNEHVAKAIVESYFHPGFDVEGVKYGSEG